MTKDALIFVVIPCYRVRDRILEVLSKIDRNVSCIIVVDDKCPEGTGNYVEEVCGDNRVKVIFNEENLGVGGAVKRGYEQAILMGADIIVKLDGDGQMDPALISELIRPILDNKADYVTGNRFWSPESINQMPKLRIAGNLVLSFMAKASTGYWKIFDINNGFTAISRNAANKIPLKKVDNRFFFESDLLFRLGLIDCAVMQIAMNSVYADEKSNLKIIKIIPDFTFKHFRNTGKRIIYSYFIRDFSIGSLNLVLGLLLSGFSIFRGLQSWHESNTTGFPTTTGTQILVAITFLAGLQFMIGFLNIDFSKSLSRNIQ